GDVADLLVVQEHGEVRSLRSDLQVVPLLLLAQAGELLVAGVEPQHVVLWTERLRRGAVDDDADELTGLPSADIDLIAGAEGDAAVVRARLVDAGVQLIRAAFGRALRAMFREREIELEPEILELT